jgi:hypothetical protein
MIMSEPSGTRPQKDKARPKPFFDAPPTAEKPVLDVGQFAPTKAGDDIEPAKGRDLAGKTKIIFVIGRGKTGKTTLLRWMAERALDLERPFLMADIDPTNASFSSYFSDVARPDTYDPGQVKAWLQRFIAYAVEQKVTAIIDLGGGDTVLRSLLAEMPAIFAEVEAAGLVPVAYYMCGPQPDDLAPIVTLKSHGFVPAARAVVFNEGVADAGLNRQSAFAEVQHHPIVEAEVQAGALVLWMPKLFAAATVESRRAAFAEVRDGTAETPVNLFDRARVRSWLEAMEYRFGGVATWLP